MLLSIYNKWCFGYFTYKRSLCSTYIKLENNIVELRARSGEGQS